MSDQSRITSVVQNFPPSVLPTSDGGKAQVGEVLDAGASSVDLTRAREQLRDLLQMKTALGGDARAIREAFEAATKNGTIGTTLRLLSAAELRRLTEALPEEKGPDSRAAFASMISRMPALPFDRETLGLLRAALVQTGYQGDIDRFDLTYPAR